MTLPARTMAACRTRRLHHPVDAQGGLRPDAAGRHGLANLSSSLPRGASRAWSLACTLLLLLFCLATTAQAVPPGTVIDNSAQASYSAWGNNVVGTSNTVTLVTAWPRTPAQIELLQYAPAVAGAQQVTVPITDFDLDGVSGGATQQIAAVYPAGSSVPIDLSQPVSLIACSLYHQGEPIFFRISDADQNLDPAAAETVAVLVGVPATADSELLLLTETGPDTGVFAGYIQSGGLGPVQSYNGVLDVQAGTQIEALYTDIADSGDSVSLTALVDPFGLVFDSTTGQPVDNVQLTLIDQATGQPATIFGDDGISTFPATIASGGTYTDSGGKVYAFASGYYRFPFVAPGTYRLQVLPPAGYAAPSTVPMSVLQSLPGAPFAIVDPGSRGEPFVINPGPALRMDIPVDPDSLGLWVRKTAQRDLAAVGDFIQYSVTVENTSAASATAVTVSDRLPKGFRYRSGSVRLDGSALADPQVSPDGRTLTFAIGDLADGAAAQIRYVTEVGAGARPGKAKNSARAASANGLASNVAVVTVTIKEDLFRSKNFIVGRVIADNCGDAPMDRADGVAGVRIYLEDGTYVVTDAQGMYHFEGVSSGSHVVQLDLETLPQPYEISVCRADTRAAGTPFSRFVDLQGGTLWRVDFHVQSKPSPAGRAALKLSCGLEGKTIEYQALINVASVPIDNLRLSILLPDGSEYIPGTSRLAGQSHEDPQVLGNALTYRLGASPAGRNDALRFDVRLNGAARPGDLHTRALLTFDCAGEKNMRTPLVDTVLALRESITRQVQPPMVLRPRFDTLSAALTGADREMLDQLVARLQGLEIEHVVLTGHTDNRLVRPGQRHRYPDNQALSLARAQSVAQYLGPRLNLVPARMTIIGKGANAPLAANTTEAGRAVNRRVEVRVMSVRMHLVHDIESIKCEDQAVIETRGRHSVDEADLPKEALAEKASFEMDRIDLECLSPGFAILAPGPQYRPAIPSIKLAVQHRPQDTLELRLNGQPVSPLNFEGRRQNKAGTVAVSFWRGVDLQVGDNHFSAVRKDPDGEEIDRLDRTMHYAGTPVAVRLVAEASRLVANGKDAPIIALQLLDKDGHPARFGIFGDYEVLPPYQAYRKADGPAEDRLMRIKDEKPRYQVGREGIARLALQPTTQSGQAVINIPLADKVHQVRVWLQPHLRNWILVGLAEGTLGYNTASGNMENLAAADQQEDYYKDGRMAFFAKGKLKGSWLLTAAFDSGREHKDPDTRLFQKIDPDTYYTLYGDATDPQHEAPSIRKLYLKIEREKFYAMFGDYDTGLDVTELSRYSRRFNGVKTEYNGERFGLSAFATETNQAFVRDEIRGDGTSGLYRLSRTNILVNSEKIVLETRDRLRSEIIVASQTLTRHVDYNIDYDAGILFFKSPVYSRDENFNPIFIVATYESDDPRDEAYTYGGRGSVKLAGGKVEIGATYVHEGPQNAEADLAGADARFDLGAGVQIKAEAATTRKQAAGDKTAGNAFLAEIVKRNETLDAKVYFREQGEDFGLGQQNGSEDQTRKIGADAALRLNQQWQAGGELYRQSNLATDAQRDVGEVQLKYNRQRYQLSTGLRQAEDRFEDGTLNTSTHLLAGASRQFMDNRLKLRVSREQAIAGNNDSVDFPTRTLVGGDYQVTPDTALFAEHEIAQGDHEDSHSSRTGLKATPWSGGRLASSMGRSMNENGERLFANLGLNQTWRLNDRWALDGGLDRTQILDQESKAPFNTNVPNATGAQEDFTALSAGAGYTAEHWSWNGRVETRLAQSEDKYGLITGVAGEVRPGLGLSVGLQCFCTDASGGTTHTDADVRLSLALRPRNSPWIVFDRLDYKLEELSQSSGRDTSRRVINNLNLNYKAHPRLQTALQYGAKYVLETIDGESYAGYTDLTGLEVRYDLTARWDLGLQASVLHSWDAGQIDYRTGISVGYSLFKNTWVSLGYNFTGFTDEDFCAADYTAQGPFLKFRFKFDQQSVREIVERLNP